MDNRLEKYIESMPKGMVDQYKVDIKENEMSIEEAQNLLIERIKRFGKSIESMSK